MNIFLGTDHAGFELKEEVKKFLMEEGHEVTDCGAHELDPNDDYPDFCAEAARKVSENEGSRGFVFGKSGAGEAITANKIRGIRAVLAVNSENVKLSREHNDANVLSLGSMFFNSESAKKLAKLFIETPFPQEERHARRIKKIAELEK
jgi:ribose 5-phosphate isomerase B